MGAYIRCRLDYPPVQPAETRCESLCLALVAPQISPLKSNVPFGQFGTQNPGSLGFEAAANDDVGIVRTHEAAPQKLSFGKDSCQTTRPECKRSNSDERIAGANRQDGQFSIAGQ